MSILKTEVDRVACEVVGEHDSGTTMRRKVPETLQLNREPPLHAVVPVQSHDDLATDDTRLASSVNTLEGAERLEREQIHRALFGDLARSPQIGRYTYLKRLGAGGMGVVIAAYDPKLDRKVALKLIHASATAMPESRARMLREAQAMARLSHPNVVQVYEVGELDDELFVAMEYIEGGDLACWLETSGASWREIVNVFLQAGRGLAAAHDANLVHRDFKPANVLIDGSGRVLVSDFGLARAGHIEAEAEAEARAAVSEPAAASYRTSLTVTGALLGTPAYMAPEQFERGLSDVKSDQFSFCVALWEALFGARPFSGSGVNELILAVLEHEPAPPSYSDVPAWVQAIVLRGLRKRPEERWPSMDALLQALADDPQARARRLRRVGLGVGLGVAAMLGLGWSVVEARERAAVEEGDRIAAEAERDQAHRNLQGEAERARAAASRAESEAGRARDALRLAALRRFDSVGAKDHVDDPTSAVALLREVETPSEVDGWRQSALEALEQPIAAAVLPGWWEVAFTPDGERVVTRSEHDTVKVWRTDGTGEAVTLGAREQRPGKTDWRVRTFALTPDGEHLAIGYLDGLVNVYSLDGEGAPLGLQGPSEQAVGLSWSPDGTQLLASHLRHGKGVSHHSLLWSLDAPDSAQREFDNKAEFISGQPLILQHPRRWYQEVVEAGGLWGANGERVHEFAEATSISATPSGAEVVTIAGSRARRHGIDGSLAATYDHASWLATDESLSSVMMTPDGARVITTTSECRLFAWDVATGALERQLPTPPPPESGMLEWCLGQAVSPDSASLAVGYADRTVRVFELDSHRVPAILRGHLHNPHDLVFSPDSRTLATTTVYVGAFSKTEGLRRARGDFKHTIRLWRLPERSVTRFSAYDETPKQTELKWISTNPWIPGSANLVLGDGLTLKLFTPEGELAGPSLEAPSKHRYLVDVSFSADGRFAFAGTATHWLRWDLREPTRVDFFAPPPGEQHGGRGWVRTLASTHVSVDGERVYYVTPDNKGVHVYALASGELLDEVSHDKRVIQVSFNPVDSSLLTVTEDQRVHVWPADGREPASIGPLADASHHNASWSDDGSLVVLSLRRDVEKRTYDIYVWRPNVPGEPELRGTLPTFPKTVRVSPDSREIALAGPDDRIRLITTKGPRVTRELDSVDSDNEAIEFSRDGAFLVSQGDHAAFIWDTKTGALVRVLRTPERRLSSASFDTSATRILLGARDGTVEIYPFDPSQARADLGQKLSAATTYCYGYERRRVDLNEPPELAWANYSACERGYGREPGARPAGAER